MQIRTCKKCGVSKLIDDFQKTNKEKNWYRHECKDCRMMYGKDWRQENAVYLKAKKKADHIRDREKNINRATLWGVNNREKKNTNSRNSARKLRKKTVAAVGDRCICCGESESTFHDIHHKQNTGAIHRKEIRHMGTKYHNNILRSDNISEQYAILCCNCNHGSARNQNICPHDKIMPKSYAEPKIYPAGNIQCSRCGENYSSEAFEKDGRKKCKNCRLIDSRAKDQKLIDECFTAYGGYICACCGEMQRLFLCIDHINNDGAIHRKEIGDGGKGRKMYRWLRQNNFPPSTLRKL
jgi:hypothetical protein